MTPVHHHIDKPVSFGNRHLTLSQLQDCLDWWNKKPSRANSKPGQIRISCLTRDIEAKKQQLTN